MDIYVDKIVNDPQLINEKICLINGHNYTVLPLLIIYDQLELMFRLDFLLSKIDSKIINLLLTLAVRLGRLGIVKYLLSKDSQIAWGREYIGESSYRIFLTNYFPRHYPGVEIKCCYTQYLECCWYLYQYYQWRIDNATCFMTVVNFISDYYHTDNGIEILNHLNSLSPGNSINPKWLEGHSYTKDVNYRRYLLSGELINDNIVVYDSDVIDNNQIILLVISIINQTTNCL